MNQPAVPANTGDILYFMRVTLFITLLCMGYSLSRPTPSGNKERELLLPASTGLGSREQERPSLPQWQRKASEKAVVKYVESQGRKWQRWNEAMFERSN